MAPIANLTVRISAQIAELQKSFTEATDKLDKFGADFKKTAESLDQSGQKIGTGFDGIVSSAVGVAAGMLTAQAAIGAVSTAFGVAEQAINATFGALQEAVKHTADLGDELFALSQKTGLSVESLSAFKFVAAQTNTSLESITGAVFKLEANLGSGAKKTADALKGIGLSVAELQKQDPAAAFTTILTKLGELPSASERAAAGVAIFGKSFKDIAQLSKEDLPALIQQAKDLGVVMSTETAVAADRFKDAIGVLEASVEGLKLQIGAQLLPAVITFVEVFGKAFTDATKTARKSTQDTGASFDELVVSLGEATATGIEILATFADAFAKWAEDNILVFTKFAKTYAALAGPMVSVAKALDAALFGGEFQIPLAAAQAEITFLKGVGAIGTAIESAAPKIRAFSQGLATAASEAGANFGTTFERIKAEIGSAADKMRTDGGAMGEGLTKVGKAAKTTKEDLNFVWKEVEELNQRVQKFDTAAMQREFKELAREAKADIDSIDQRVQRFQRSTDDAAAKMQQQLFELNIPLTGGVGGGFGGIGFSQGQIQSFGLFGQQAAAKTAAPFKEAFTRLGQELPQLISRGFQQGGTIGAFAAVADGAASEFSGIFQKGLDRIGKEGGELTGKELGAGMAAAAVKSFTTGFATGVQMPNAAGFITSAVGGLLTGLTVPGGAGVGLGLGIAGFIAGAEQSRNQTMWAVAQAKQDLLTQFHGMEALKQRAEQIGFTLSGKSGAASIDQLFRINDPKDFAQAINTLNRALDTYNEKLKAIASSTEGVNRRTANFAKQFEPLVTKRNEALAKQQASPGDSDAARAAKDAQQQIQELAQRTQPEFERLGLFVRDTFAAMVKDSGNAIQAITALAPSFQLLKDGITDFGLTSTAVIDSLVGAFDIVTNEAFKPFFENIASTGELLKGLMDANALSPDTFQAAAADIGQSIQEIINRGGDMAKTLALSAPELQTLWEAQQKYGQVTDQTTQSILDQAVQQGIVGEQFKSTNDKILDVLLAIADVFHADIPDGLRAMAAASKTAAQDVTDNLSKIKAPEIKVPISFESDDPRVRFFGEAPEPRPMAVGGIVTRPTLALVGEAGPEAVIPLSRLGPAPANVGRGGDVYLDGRKVGKVMLRHVADEAMYQGLVPR